jgi:multidrug resistance efflux pump
MPAPLSPVQPSLSPRQGSPRRVRRRTWPQLVGGALISGACVAAAVWYVPRVMTDDRLVMTGTVSSSGVVALNFADPGQIGKVNVRLDQVVHKGEVLAVEYAPEAQSVVTADKAAVAAAKAKIAQLRAAAATNPGNASIDSAELSAAKAQLAAAQSQLATDRMKVIATEIVAPAAGTVVAVNGQPGVAVTTAGIRSYATDTRQSSTTQGPQFSLVPEGPQAVRRNGTPNTSLPVVALRVSTDWQVVALIPEGSVSSCQAGRKVTISVPTVRITNVAGRVQQVIPTPVSTAQGPYYQAVITITGHTVTAPMNGMAADIRLG